MQYNNNTLIDKLKNIDSPKIQSLPQKEHFDTIEELFNNFIKDKLPSTDVIKDWHRLLMNYIDDTTNLSCCVRYGNSGSKKSSSQNESGYYKLRRGWLTRNKSDGFEYFFADNFFSSFIYKMAMDGFVPTLEEFREVFKAHKFPYGFGYKIDKKINEYKGVVVPTAHEPGFLGNYKLSHVFDSGNFFDVGDGKSHKDSDLSDIYYPIGHSNDYLSQKDHIRIMDISEESKKVIIAKFLRFAHPFNYFLTPSKKHHVCGIKVYKNDIGEEPLMVNYVKQYLEKTYPKEYKEFLEKIMWFDVKGTDSTGKEQIDITFGKDVNKSGSKKISKVAKNKHNKYSEDVLLELIKCFLTNNVTYAQLDKDFLKCPTDRHGNTSYTLIKRLGFVTDDKNSLSHYSIDDLISSANGKRKDTLIKVKDKYNL